MAGEYLPLLKEVAFFSDLAGPELEKIARLVVLRRYRPQMYVFMEGEPGLGLYFVLSGKVKLTKAMEDGRAQILHFLQAGDIFAEVLLFDRGACPATAEVMEEAEIGLIRCQDMDGVLRENPEMALKILKVMSRRLRQAQMRLQDLAMRDVGGRLASAILKLAQEHGEKQAQGVLIGLTLSQQDLAELIGSSRETVARLMSDLKRRGILEVSRGRILLKDPQKLQRMV